ncbi:Six-hairpin glycosidase [Microthyrium microscopicum]|uniref:Six-hairpin glycosidase n=1 Tax=Microthyrium microscopicum TaxID=703497 RepID=A0A6A6U3E6_9PEZI|nr:Six-hairpin glycosidase [Microthyrium microscopicum]
MSPSRPLILLVATGLLAIAALPLLYSVNINTPAFGHRYEGGLTTALEELHHALQTMQDTYFQLWLGTWPTCIDWTAAVMGTYVSASLYSLTRSLDYDLPPRREQPVTVTAEGQRIENEINKYFSQAISYYFGEDAFSLRNQAYDDMLWVVLGWLENLRFINLHIDAHYPTQGDHSWYGKQFEGAFAHRARIFYDLAKRGYDESDCGGGMNWNPKLQPYKNAITNQLFISASAGMYLYFPGDDNSSPFLNAQDKKEYGKGLIGPSSTPYARPHDPEYLRAAIAAYDWLANSNMTNHQGLYIDGFHISRYPWSRSGICDQRNEMVYSYNQGVVLSGLRSLWESTGHLRYLQDGHRLLRNVISATGYNLSSNTPGAGQPGDDEWHGLGRNGVLEDYCDSRGICSQDGQNFKGLFFHHFTLFCESLPRTPLIPGISFAADASVFALHSQSCKEYSPWVARNAVAAMRTRDARGHFGGWWGDNGNDTAVLPLGAEDYRNDASVMQEDRERWGEGWAPIVVPPPSMKPVKQAGGLVVDGDVGQAPMIHARDANDRGRGRTVETQGAGVALVRAMWEFVFEHTVAPGGRRGLRW